MMGACAPVVPGHQRSQLRLRALPRCHALGVPACWISTVSIQDMRPPLPEGVRTRSVAGPAELLPLPVRGKAEPLPPGNAVALCCSARSRRSAASRCASSSSIDTLAFSCAEQQHTAQAQQCTISEAACHASKQAIPAGTSGKGQGEKAHAGEGVHTVHPGL